MNPRLINKRTLESLVAAGALDELEPDRARANAAVDAMMALAQRSLETAAGGMDDMFGGVAAAEVALRIPPYEPWPASVRLQKEYAAVGFFLSGHPLDEFGAGARAAAGAEMGRFLPRREGRRCRSGASPRRCSTATSAAPRAAARWASSCSPTRPGISRRSSSRRGCSKYRDLLEPGRALVLVLQAGLEGDEVRARIQSAESLDEAAARHQKGMRIFLRTDEPIPSVESRLRERGEGEVSLVLILDAGEREVEVKLPGRYQVSPQIAGALRAAPGVVHVEMS